MSTTAALFELKVSSANGTISFELIEKQKGGGFTQTEGTGQTTTGPAKAVYKGEKIPQLRDREEGPQYFILVIQNGSARLILTKDVKKKAGVVFDKIYKGDQVPQLDGVYGGSWVQNLALP